MKSDKIPALQLFRDFALESDDFNASNVLEAAVALQRVLAERTHPKKNLQGEIIQVPSTLAKDLKLPHIIKRLTSKVWGQRQKGLEEFQELWETLANGTRKRVEDQIGWYDPNDLDWDDPRSNRKPLD